MPGMIKDGQGTNNLAHVNQDGQLVTRSVGVEQRLKSSLDHNYFEATTGRITLTDANETGIIYIKNTNSSKVLIIDRVFYDIWTSTDGTGADGILRYYKDCTITGGTNIIPNCMYYGSVYSAEGTFKKSLSSVSGTEWWSAYITDKQSVWLEEGRMVLPVNEDHAISVTAPTGNTSMIISMNIAFYYFDKSLV
jgi:hypothetical protein